MESFISENAGLVAAVLVGLLTLLVGQGKREFNAIQRHQDRQDKRLDEMGSKLGQLKSDQADSKRDRAGLHSELAQSFEHLEKQLSAMDKNNYDAHQMIVRLIRNNGHE